MTAVLLVIEFKEQHETLQQTVQTTDTSTLEQGKLRNMSRQTVGLITTDMTQLVSLLPMQLRIQVAPNDGVSDQPEAEYICCGL